MLAFYIYLVYTNIVIHVECDVIDLTHDFLKISIFHYWNTFYIYSAKE